MTQAGTVVASFTFGVLTLSDKGARGARQDTAGPLVKHMLLAQGFEAAAYRIIPDEYQLIVATLEEWVDIRMLDLIITTGGTGVAPRDVTPEATRAVLDRLVPGLAEAMRQASMAKTVQAVWSRAVAGIRKQSLIINLPGSERAARENLEAILPALEHGLYKLKGGKQDCGG